MTEKANIEPFPSQGGRVTTGFGPGHPTLNPGGRIVATDLQSGHPSVRNRRIFTSGTRRPAVSEADVTATGSTELWALAERWPIVPSPPDPVLAELLASWWSTGRTFGCVAARANAWFVVPPDPSIWCPRVCGGWFAAERRCCYCREPVRVSQAIDAGVRDADVRVLGRATGTVPSKQEEMIMKRRSRGVVVAIDPGIQRAGGRDDRDAARKGADRA